MRAKGREGGGEDVAGGDGVADAVLGLPVLHWYLLIQEGVGWLQLGLPVQGSPGVGLHLGSSAFSPAATSSWSR